MYFNITVEELLKNYKSTGEYMDDDVIAEYKDLLESGEATLADEVTMIRVLDIQFQSRNTKAGDKVTDDDGNEYIITENLYLLEDFNEETRYVLKNTAA